VRNVLLRRTVSNKRSKALQISDINTCALFLASTAQPSPTNRDDARCHLLQRSGISALCQSRLSGPQMRAANGRARLHSWRIRRGQARTSASRYRFRTGMTMHQWLPSQRAIKLDCIIVEQIPARTITASSERGLTAFLTPKGRNYGPGGNEQSDGRSIKRSRGHRLRSSGYHDPSVDLP
jgi:hypothetical protein